MVTMIGTDHSRAPVSVRSSLFLTQQRLTELMGEIRERLAVEGVVILSTCNRLEIWVNTSDDEMLPEIWLKEAEQGKVYPEDPLLGLFCSYAGLTPEEYEPYFAFRSGERAVSHLFYLACGLRSAILAEDQVLTQVKQALDFSRDKKMAGSCMEVLFRTAVTAAKKIKTEVVFSRANASAIEQAVQRLEDQGFPVAGKTCMVIGNGEYGRLAATTLLQYGADVMMTLRQYHSGNVALPQGCRPIAYDDRYQYIPQCQVVVSATASPHYTIRLEKLRACQAVHKTFLLDLAVPRDIEPGIRELPPYTLYDIDDFSTSDSEENAKAYLQAEKIMDKYIREYHLWEGTRDLRPRIQCIQEDAVASVNLRLGKAVRKLPVEEKEKEILLGQIDTAVGKVVNKLIYDLQDYLPEEEFRHCVAGMEKVFRKG